MRDPARARPRAEVLEARETPAAQGLYAVGGGPGGPPRVRVYETASNTLVGDFLAFENTFTGGATTAVGDVNNDGFADVIVGAGVGGGPRVKVFDGRLFRPGLPGSIVSTPILNSGTVPDTGILADFFVFESTQRGGAYVASGNFIGSTNAELVIGAGPGGGPRVRILDGQAVTTQGRQFTSNRDGDTVANFFAFESTFRNGITVAATPSLFGGTFSDLVVAPSVGGGPRVRVLNGTQIGFQRLNYSSFGTNDAIADFFAFDQNQRGGLSVTAGDFDRDGIADVAVGSGAGIPGQVIVYSGTAIRQRGSFFVGTAAGDQIDSFTVITDTPTYTNGVTVGTALQPGGITNGLLLVGSGGQGRVGKSQVIQYAIGGGFASRQVLAETLFDPNFRGGVFVSS